MDVCQKTKRGNVSSEIYIICDPLDENRTYEAIIYVTLDTVPRFVILQMTILMRDAKLRKMNDPKPVKFLVSYIG